MFCEGTQHSPPAEAQWAMRGAERGLCKSEKAWTCITPMGKVRQSLLQANPISQFTLGMKFQFPMGKVRQYTLGMDAVKVGKVSIPHG